MYGGRLGVHVNAVAPGIAPTELFAAAAQVPGGMNDIIARAATTSLRRAATAQQIAAVAAFLLSDETAYITGEMISADGGAASVSAIRRRAAPGPLGRSGRGRRTYGR